MTAGKDAAGLLRDDIERLFDLLDARLRRRGVRASIYVVGGAAIAMTVEDSRRTLDVDAVADEQSVLEEARLLAEEQGLPPTWLNDAARPWIPPLPEGATVAPTRLGLTVRLAPVDHLLAMKLVAARPQDVPDIVALAKVLGLGDDPAAYADLLERVYDGEGALEQVLGGRLDDVRVEALRRGEVACRLVRAAVSDSR